MEKLLKKLEQSQLTIREQQRVLEFIDFLVYQRQQKKGVGIAGISSSEDGEMYKGSPASLRTIVMNYPEDTEWTYSLLRKAFPFEYKAKVEIIQGQISIGTAPNAVHQRIVRRLTFWISTYIEEQKHQSGEILSAPLDVVLNEKQVIQPDISFIRSERGLMNAEGFVEGAPDLMIEVVSPANFKQLREQKLKMCAEHNIAEYWEIHPKQQSCTVRVLKRGTYEIYAQVRGEEAIQSFILEGFQVKVSSLFE